MKKCFRPECEEMTENPKFCSRRCSAIHTNTTNPKRKKEGLCKSCKKPVSSKSVYCVPCFKDSRRVDWSNVTLRDAMYNERRASRWVKVREHARKTTRDWPCVCELCGYSKHVERHHIVPISQFPLEALVVDVNSKRNLVLLCPNCHWEVDNGVTELK